MTVVYFVHSCAQKQVPIPGMQNQARDTYLLTLLVSILSALLMIDAYLTVPSIVMDMSIGLLVSAGTLGYCNWQLSR